MTSRVLSMLLVLACVATACGGKPGEQGDTVAAGKITVAGEEANDHGRASVSGMTRAGVELDDFYFGPTVLEGEAGQTLTLRASNEGQASHTFTIEASGIDVELTPGEETSVEVTFPQAGALLFACRFHAARGMRGALSVGGDLTAATAGTGAGDTGPDDTGSGGGEYDPYA